MDNEMLIKNATLAADFAYSPYSKIKIGACLLTKSGKIYMGCNVENSSYGATNCAERTAIFKAVSEGEKEFEKIAIVNISKAGLTYPCGICRQVLHEFMPDGSVILKDIDEKIVVYSFKDEILPNAFLI